MKIKAVHTHTQEHTQKHTHTELEESSTSKENLLVLNPAPPAGLTSCISLKDLYDANRWFNTPLNALALVHSCVWSRLSSAVAPCSFTPAEGHRQMGCKCVALAEDPPASGVRRALLQRLLNTPAREPTGRLTMGPPRVPDPGAMFLTVAPSQ